MGDVRAALHTIQIAFKTLVRNLRPDRPQHILPVTVVGEHPIPRISDKSEGRHRIISAGAQAFSDMLRTNVMVEIMKISDVNFSIIEAVKKPIHRSQSAFHPSRQVAVMSKK